MEGDLFCRLEHICNTLLERKIDRIYLYPFGRRGLEIFDFIKNRYGFWKIVAVDNGLSKHNFDIKDFNYMEKEILVGNAVVLLTSDNPLLYRELRLWVERAIPKERIVDCFEENPLCFSKDSRVAALALAAKQIYSNQVEGCVAEAGVYQGKFAKYINVLFPDRRLYLFDTFQGFEIEQVDCNADNIKQTGQWIEGLKDTTINLVLKKMRYQNQIVIKQGLFPGTTEGIKEKFAFVNLDMDLYKPTYEGLLYFWERMSPGGYLFVHDFDNWDGIRVAVMRFCKEKNATYVCLNDTVTVCIGKPME